MGEDRKVIAIAMCSFVVGLVIGVVCIASMYGPRITELDRRLSAALVKAGVTEFVLERMMEEPNDVNETNE